MRESSVERKFRLMVRSLNGRAIKLQRTGKRGEPDRIVVLPNGITVWAELKRPGKKPRPEQARAHAWLRRRGHKVMVVDGTNWHQTFTYLRGLAILGARHA
jgi:hypothetical protein